MDKRRCILAVEDRLSEDVGKRVLLSLGIDAIPGPSNRGNGYLKQKIADLNKTARAIPVLVITDLDEISSCPQSLITKWLPKGKNPKLYLRVAVVEIESWLMADRDAISKHLGISIKHFPSNSDTIPQPKEYLLNLVRKHSKKKLREALLPKPGSTAKIGPEYNLILSEFVQIIWDPTSAATVSPSLNRAMLALEKM